MATGRWGERYLRCRRLRHIFYLFITTTAEVKIVALLLLRCAKDEGDIVGLRAMMLKCTSEYELWDADTSFEHVAGSFKTRPEVILWVKNAIASAIFSASTM